MDIGDNMKKRLQIVGSIIGAIVVGVVLVVSSSMIAFPAISELAGLAVAQSDIQWNNVKDASQGDGLTSGVMAQSSYLFNGLSFDRLRSVPASDGNAGTGFLAQVVMVFNGTTYDRLRGGITADDNAATGLLNNVSLVFDGTNYDRIRSASGDGLAATGIQAVGNLMFNGSTWDRVRGTTTNGMLVEKKTVGTSFYSIKRDNIAGSSVNLAYGFTSRKIAIEAPLTNTDEVCVDWIGGTAVCPAANTAGDGRLAPGSSILLDDFAGTSISVISSSGTQTVFVRAWN